MKEHRRTFKFIFVPSLLSLLFMTSFGITLAHTTTPGVYSTASPIQHLVVIFQENVSFDHYFATYPKATNPAGEPTRG